MKKASSLEWQDLKRIAEIKGLGVLMTSDEAAAHGAAAGASVSASSPTPAAGVAVPENADVSGEALPAETPDEVMPAGEPLVSPTMHSPEQ